MPLVHLVAHSAGMGWDELIVFAIPVVILVVLQFVGRRKRADLAVAEKDDGGHEEAT